MINSFSGKYFFLSNFYRSDVVFENDTYRYVENAFQAAKCKNRKDRQPFLICDPKTARKQGRRVILRDDWQDIKVEIMAKLVLDKFTRNKYLAKQLKLTYPHELIEGNRWHDAFWGVDLNTGVGDNHLGRILMDVRARLM